MAKLAITFKDENEILKISSIKYSRNKFKKIHLTSSFIELSAKLSIDHFEKIITDRDGNMFELRKRQKMFVYKF